MPSQAVFFDLGGVILRTEHQAPRALLAERLNMTYEEIDQLVFASESSRQASLGTITTEQHWEAVMHRLGRPMTEAGAIRGQFFAGDVLDRGLLDFIRSLRTRRKTGLISNGWPDLRRYIVDNKFEDAFDTLVISAEVGLMKPGPEIYHLALGRLGMPAEAALFIDDLPANLEGARAVGMQAVLFRDSAQTMRDIKDMLS